MQHHRDAPKENQDKNPVWLGTKVPGLCSKPSFPSQTSLRGSGRHPSQGQSFPVCCFIHSSKGSAAKSVPFLLIFISVLPAFKRIPSEAKGRGRDEGARPGSLPDSVHHGTQMSIQAWPCLGIQLQKASLEPRFMGRGEMRTIEYLPGAEHCTRNLTWVSQNHMEGSIFPFYRWGN